MLGTATGAVVHGSSKANFCEYTPCCVYREQIASSSRSSSTLTLGPPLVRPPLAGYNSLRTPAGTASKEAQAYVWPILYAASGFGSYLIAQNLDAPAPGFNGAAAGSLNPAARNTAVEALNLVSSSSQREQS